MKKLLLLIITVICLSGFRAPNGNIISRGDLVDKLIVNLGEPYTRIHLGTFLYWGNIYIIREARTYRIGQYILRAVMFAAFMARLFCSIARRENRRIASYVTVFATPLSGKRAR